jgi:alanine dehydrogenase
MIVGVPKEIKQDEYRVAMLPVGVEELVRRGHQVLVEAGAGLGSGIADHDYLRQGCEMVSGPEEIFGRADLIVKVKEPLPPEWPLIRQGQTVFTYFHFAADQKLTEAMLTSGATSVAYETLADDRGRLPLLTPMSEVAGRMSIQEGAKYLERPQMGRGILLGGVPGVAPARTRPRSPPASARTSPSSTSTWTASATSTTPCHRTSTCCSAIATRSANSSNGPTW